MLTVQHGNIKYLMILANYSCVLNKRMCSFDLILLFLYNEAISNFRLHFFKYNIRKYNYRLASYIYVYDFRFFYNNQYQNQKKKNNCFKYNHDSFE